MAVAVYSALTVLAYVTPLYIYTCSIVQDMNHASSACVGIVVVVGSEMPCRLSDQARPVTWDLRACILTVDTQGTENLCFWLTKVCSLCATLFVSLSVCLRLADCKRIDLCGPLWFASLGIQLCSTSAWLQ